MKLFDLIKDRLKDPVGVISDSEMVLLNRRDFLYSETSPTKSLLMKFNAQKVSYEMYSIIDLLNTLLSKKSEIKTAHIYQFSKTMTLPCLASSVFLGGAPNVKIYCPRGYEVLQPSDPFVVDLWNRYKNQIVNQHEEISEKDSDDTFSLLLCNASNEADINSALKVFEKVQRGAIIIKGYGRRSAPNCGDATLALGINVHCSPAGYGMALTI